MDPKIGSDMRDRTAALKRQRTPRSSNSSGYFLGLDMTAENLLSPRQHPGSEVPRETRSGSDRVFRPPQAPRYLKASAGASAARRDWSSVFRFPHQRSRLTLTIGRAAWSCHCGGRS
jgi:hypothetical protein